MSYIDRSEERWTLPDIAFACMGGILAILLLMAASDEAKDKGRCVKTRHVKEFSYYMSKPPMWRTVPAHDVCDQWEFPEGRPTK